MAESGKVDGAPKGGGDGHTHEKEHSSEMISMVTMNLCGRFKGKEIRRYGQEVLKYILKTQGVTVFFGQQMNFRPSLPHHFVFEGGSRAFVYYDKNIFRGCDEKQYRHYLKDMENKGRIKRYYLPEANYVIVKMRARANPRNKFLAISWMTDECQGKLKSLNLVRKLLSFAADLCAIEEMPVIVGGTFRITLEEAKNIVYTEFEGFRVYGYMATRPKRMLRMSNFYFTAKPVRMDEVKPLVCSKIEVHSDLSERWLNPEDAFYWDPVITKVKLKRYSRPSGGSPPKPHLQTSVLAAHVSQTPGKRVRGEWTKLETQVEQKEPSVASDTWSDFTEMERRIKREEEEAMEEKANLKSAISAPLLATKYTPEPQDVPDVPVGLPPKHERTLQSVPDLDDPAVFAKLEDTLRRIEDRRSGRKATSGMAATSAEIQETLLKLSAEDAEVEHITSNGTHQGVPFQEAHHQAQPGDCTDSRVKTPHGFINPDEYDLSVNVTRKEGKIPGFDTFGLKMELTRQDELDIQLADATHLLQSISTDRTNMRVVEGASQPDLAFGHSSSRDDLLNTDSAEEFDVDDVRRLESPVNGILKKIPSYIELYDEELLESNTLCYMQ